jgi:hypothetical protein
MKFVQLGALALACASLGACATVTRGTNTDWQVSSSPVGARVETSHGHTCASTPCTIRMPRKSQFVATLTKDGFKPATITVNNKVSTGGGTAMAGNLLVGGIIGAAVDGSNGAMLDLTPNPATVTLEPIGASVADASTKPVS